MTQADGSWSDTRTQTDDVRGLCAAPAGSRSGNNAAAQLTGPLMQAVKITGLKSTI